MFTAARCAVSICLCQLVCLCCAVSICLCQIVYEGFGFTSYIPYIHTQASTCICIRMHAQVCMPSLAHEESFLQFLGIIHAQKAVTIATSL